MNANESKCYREKRRKFKLYLISMIIAIIMIVGTGGAFEQNIITPFEAFWQMGCSMVLGWSSWILMSINEKRVCIHRCRR